jgi:cytochrome c peroxidase
MSEGNGQAVLSVEDAVRAAIPSPEARKAFREKWPMYDADELAASIAKIDDDIEQFEEAIIKANGQKRQWKELLAECKRRDTVLATMKVRDA